MSIPRACVNLVGDRFVGASLVGALGALTNTGNHKGYPYMYLTY